MNVTIRKIGNSEGVIIPKDVLDRMNVKAGDELEITIKDGALQMKPLDEAFQRQLEHAHRFMERYKVALKKLAE